MIGRIILGSCIGMMVLGFLTLILVQKYEESNSTILYKLGDIVCTKLNDDRVFILRTFPMHDSYEVRFKSGSTYVLKEIELKKCSL